MAENLANIWVRANIPPSIVTEYLWKKDDCDRSVWAILDGQWIDDLVLKLLESKLEYCSLFEGPLTQENLAASPYLVRLSPNDPFTAWLLEKGWGHGWGVFFQASENRLADLYPHATFSHIIAKRAKGEFFGSDGLENSADRSMALLLRKHFRKYTRVNLESDSRVVAFRFFDPAVLQMWLRSANDAEIASFMHPIRCFLVEDYCDDENLNRPDCLYIFSYDTSSKDSFIARRYDHTLNEVIQLQRFPASSVGVLAVEDNGLMLLREPVQQQFETRQLSIFKEEIVQDIVKVRSKNGIESNLHELRRTIDVQVDKAISLGLSSRRNLANYVLCYFRYGNDFVSKIPELEKAFTNRVSERGVEPLLVNFAEEDRLAGEKSL